MYIYIYIYIYVYIYIYIYISLKKQNLKGLIENLISYIDCYFLLGLFIVS